ncbi:MAG: MFS transporter [Candidatus Odinarchaeota archaeon]
MMDRRAELITIFLIMFTEILGFSLIIPVLPYFATYLGASPLVVGLILTIFSLCQFISAPIFGKLSDKFGRKPLLLVSQASTFAGFLILAFANSLELVFLSRIIDGLLGSNFSLSRAYLGDIVEPRDQKRMFGYLGAVGGHGFFIGPAIGGFMATVDYSLPFLVAAGISLLSIVLVVVFLKETVVKEKEVKIKLDDIFPLRDLVGGFKSSIFRPFLLMYLCFVLAHTMLTSSVALFADYQLDVGPDVVGLYLMFVGLLRILFQTTAYPRLVKTFSTTILLLTGFLSMLVAFIGVFLVKSPVIMFLILGTFSIGSGIARPTLSSEISSRASLKTRGRLMGVADSLQSLAQIITPLIGGYIIEHLEPGLLGVAAAIIVLPALTVVFLTARNKTTETTKTDIPISMPADL